MKISFVIHSLGGGGAERVTAHMANYWTRRGNDVCVITVASAKKNLYQLDRAVRVVSLEREENSTGLVSGVKNNVSRILALRKSLKMAGSEVVISLMPTSNVVTFFACLKLPILHLASERHYPGRDYTGRMWSLARKYTYGYIDSIITQTELGQQWIKENTTAKRTMTIPNPLVLPLETTSPHVPVNKGRTRKILLSVGRLTAQKQFSHLIEAFAKVSERYDFWDLVILGEGEERTELESLIHSLKLERRIRLVGRVGNVKDWYEESDVFALTSESEGFPNALIEAMGHEMACASYDCMTGPSDVIVHEENGCLVEANNQEELVKTLGRVMGSEALRAKLSENAGAIRSLLHPDKIMREWEKEIKYLEK